MKNAIALGLKIAVFNFFVVAVWGVIMRYKVLFPLHFLEQKNLIDAHSHFAFYGWITMAIYFLILHDLKSKAVRFNPIKYYAIAIINFLGAYGMLIAFTYKDYYWFSIVCSAVSLLASFAFYFCLMYDLKKEKFASKIWYLGGLFLAVISSVGVFYLSYRTANKQLTDHIYYASIYYFLHFQYNGFYIFSCIGLLFSQLQKLGVVLTQKRNQLIFWLFFVSCLITYGLSILFLNIPDWVLALFALGTIIQIYGSVYLLQLFIGNRKLIKSNWPKMRYFILIFVGVAFVVKTLLQFASNSSDLNQYAFQYRAVAIGYFHLVLLTGIATLLLSELYHSPYFKMAKIAGIGLVLYLFATFFNQVYLGLQAWGQAISHQPIENSNEILLGLGLLIMISLLMIFGGMKIKDAETITDFSNFHKDSKPN